MSGKPDEAYKLYSTMTAACESSLVEMQAAGTSPDPMFFHFSGVAYNDIAFYTHVPVQNWQEAELCYLRAIQLLEKSTKSADLANTTLNLQTVYKQTNKPLDRDLIIKMTDILKQANDARAKKGDILLDRI
jgi:hypothetical protein